MLDDMRLFDLPPEQQTLAERWGAPPFTVLDGRAGYWRERKQRWLSLGIRSELGRGSDLLSLGAAEGASQRYYDAERNPASPGGWKGESSAMSRNHPFMSRRKGHAAIPGGGTGANSAWLFRDADGTTTSQQGTNGTSVFDPVLCELVYRWFCPPEGAVLDPFAGGSVRGIVASVLGRPYTGLDLSRPQVVANRLQAAEIVPDASPRWIVGDSRQVGELAPGRYDLVFSCPPYSFLERYSDDPADLSTLPYEEFLPAYREIIAGACAMLEPDRFAAFVVGNVRAKDGRGALHSLVHDTVLAFEAAGLSFYNDAVFVTPTGSLPIRAGRIFSASRKLGRGHQMLLVFLKGDQKRASEACGIPDLPLEHEGEGGEEAFDACA